jgi:hypothetical protein
MFEREPNAGPSVPVGDAGCTLVYIVCKRITEIPLFPPFEKGDFSFSLIANQPEIHNASLTETPAL